MSRPTEEFYGAFQFIYDYFNHHLFNAELPDCMIVITRKKRTLGYFSPGRWVNSEEEKTDELAMNPLYFNEYPLIGILQTMVHEMCHLWQHHFGKPSKRSYHNKEWGRKMIEVGLHPSNTGRPGGKTTGQQMMDYPIKEGRFIIMSNALIKEDVFRDLWYDPIMLKDRENMSPEQIEGTHDDYAFYDDYDLEPELLIVNETLSTQQVVSYDPSKCKYTCINCKTNVWGKGGLNLFCGDCGTQYIGIKC